MYDEMGKDLVEKKIGKRPVRAPQWGKAVQRLLKQKSGSKHPLPVSWLAHKTGINDKNLHNLIGGRVRDMSSDKLVKISDAFGISFSEFATRAMAENDGNFFVCGFDERGAINYSQHGFTIQSLSPQTNSQRDFFFGRMTLKPFKELRKWQFRQDSTVAIFVESGTLEMTYGDLPTREISANESAYFDAGVPHKIKNIDSIEAKLFIVTSPSIF
ncbi:MAG: cupin domain-containing protein [Candidatus Omnitrophota bacterium]